MNLSPSDYPNTFNTITEFKNQLIATVDKSLIPRSDEIRMETDKITIHLQLNFETNQHPHDEIVYNSIVHGRKAGKMPNPNDIRVWIARKGISPYPTKQLSFLIARSIGLYGTGEFYRGKNKSFFKGTTPKMGYEQALKQLEPTWKPRIEEAYGKDVENLMASETDNEIVIR